MDNTTEAMLTLTLVPGLGGRLISRLLAHFGHPSKILSASPQQLRQVRGIGAQLAQAISRPPVDQARVVWLQCQQEQIKLLTLLDPEYPENLRTIADAPAVLYLRGSLQPGDSQGIAIVGTRRCSSYGRSQALRLARELAQCGITVISGLARGIDAAAHQGALQGGGRTLAVLGSGLQCIYPPEHRGLAQAIAQQGALISEFTPPTGPQAPHFPRRNRIISGLALGVLIIEAGRRSGALITADIALEQGREVLALPGCINTPHSQGTLRLIQQGAKLVCDLQDILEEFPQLTSRLPCAQPPLASTLQALDRAILACLDHQPRPVDEIIAESGLPAHVVCGRLVYLETQGWIHAGLDGYQRVRPIDEGDQAE